MKNEKIIIKTPDIGEFEDVNRIDSEAWSVLPPVPDEKEDLFNILKTFPEGFLSVYVDGEIAGNCYTVRLNYDIDHPVRTWEEVSGNSRADNHDANGDTLYVIALGISPRFRGRGLGEKLIRAQQDNCVKFGCKALILGCRVPDYHQHSDMRIEDYIKWKDDNGKYIDKELRFYSKCGMEFIKPLPEYMSGNNADPYSLNYGVLSVWNNDLYSK
ncbi:GNAT family N-acetyltransferase [Anaerovorax odorimutans]|uniref:GNAT family N-acetyltransferase n=1 Tax=Anaerovorax odorimutans TaxID=109327 RepID=A0ABT1RQW4_9FIRM|nr:GNAT family N-acetyltransferase [Anaerovorax odorimutans]MCQ4637589.1 GNAT family N-acetyltransferase [Anaerovorax odorimutans]